MTLSFLINKWNQLLGQQTKTAVPQLIIVTGRKQIKQKNHQIFKRTKTNKQKKGKNGKAKNQKEKQDNEKKNAHIQAWFMKHTIPPQALLL